MKILVCVSKTPDTTAKISFNGDNTEFNAAGVQFIMNPYDEWYALVKALEIQESIGGTVTIINVGGTENETIIRKGLAIGAEAAVRINAEPKSAMFTAFQIAQYAKDNAFDLILTGKETIDFNGAEVGAMIAEYLDLPFLSFINNMTLNGNTATTSREIEGGSEIAEVELPFVASAAKDLAQQRIPNMRGIMMAKSKPLTVVEPAAFTEVTITKHFELPPAKTSVKMVDADNMDELVRLLHEEAKVI